MNRGLFSLNKDFDIRECKKAAKAGNPEAIYALGRCYIYGKGVEEDEKKGFQLISKSAEQGLPEGLFLLGKCYYYGWGTEEDEEKAVECYEKAAEKDYPEAICKLGECYLYGFGVEEDEKKGFQLVSKSAKQGLPEGLFLLGECYYYGWGTEKDEEKAVECYEKAAEEDFLEAIYALGKCYIFGNGIEEDEEKGFQLVSKSAEQGLPEGLFLLGKCYYYGWGTEQDKEKAIEYYEKAAEKDYPEAIYKLGECYLYGFGVEEDKEKGIDLIEEAADKNYLEAVYDLGRFFLEGFYVEQDEEKGIDLLEKAANRNHIKAIYKLGDFYLHGGVYVEEDEEQGIELLEKAIDKEYLPAFYRLAEYYQENDEDRKAFKIYKKGKELDDEECIIQLGLCYLQGKGTFKDEEKGIDLLEAVVDEESCDAVDALSDYYYETKKYDDYFSLLKRGTKLERAKYFIKLGKCYQKGIGTEKNEIEAFNLIEKAAIKFDDGEAYYELGTFYEKGIGVKKNPEKAELFYDKAKENGFDPPEPEPETKKRLKDYYNMGSEKNNSYEIGINYNTDKAIIQSCVVYIESDKGSGSGFIIDTEGHIATCAHVVKDAEELYIKFTDENKNKIVYKGKVINLNEETDTAIIEIGNIGKVINLNEKTDTAIMKIENKRTFPFIDLDDRAEAETGEEIVIYGYPLGDRLNDDVLKLNISFGKGFVSSNQVIGIKRTMLDISAKHGNSGSPIISCENGKVIGLLSGAVPGQEAGDEVNYMIPICYLHDLLKAGKMQEESQTSAESPENWAEIKHRLKDINKQILHITDVIEKKYID